MNCKRTSFLIFLIVISGITFFQSCSSSKKTASQKRPESHAPLDQESVLQHISQADTSADDTLMEERQAEANSPDSVNIDAIMTSMTLREKIGQLFYVWASGYYESDDNEPYQELISKIRNDHIGGLIFSSGNVYGQAVIYNKLQSLSNIPLWITEDMEYGAAMRVQGATRFAPAMGIAATQNPDYAYWSGKITAREAKTLGVNQIFAPVLDVNNNPDNPVINVRSFSADPKVVSTFGNRFIDGVESEGLVATAKHFPGHGDTDTDSHLALPVIKYGYNRLDSLELVPFRSAIQHGIRSIMSAHIAFPNISKNPDLPGTLDPSILHRILRDSLNFKGVIVTDGLEMSGIASNFSPGQAVVKALKAGADMMLLSPDIETALNDVQKAVEDGIITEKRIDQSVRKILHWKKQYGLFKNHQLDINKISSVVHTRSHELVADEISRKSLTLVRNANNILPIRASNYPKLLVISVADDETGNTGSYFAQKIRDYHPDVMFHVFDRRSGQEEKKNILRDARKADLIIIGSFIYVRSGQPVQISSEQLSFLNKLPANKPSVLVAFGNPYVVQDLPHTDVQLMAWSANSDQIRNTVPALFGGTTISGRLPINIPHMYSIGDGITLPQSTLRFDQPETVGLSTDSLRTVDHIMQQAVLDSTFPGGVVSVVKDGVIAYQKGYGYYTYDKHEKVRNNEIYDLASLTKILATTTSIMKLISEHKVGLNDKVYKYFPEFKQGEKQQITIRNLLMHNSGLPAFRVYVDSIKTAPEIIHAIKNEPLIYKTGTQYVYSDLGFILLGKIVEQVTGMRLDQYVRKTFYYPMGMNSTFYNPRQIGSWLTRRIPPTEIDTVFRHKMMQGEVHDERAYYLNGVAGHAGLFSSATDMSVYAQMILNGGSYAGIQYLNPKIVKEFTTLQSKISTRAYGFDTKSEDFSSGGSLTSDDTFGHTGFTGTSMWIDPERNLAIIILTNRVYPYRSYGHNISHIRSNVADAVVSSITSE